MHGLLLIDKPSGPTSFDVIRVVRRVASQRKAGHAGTLDPLASGLLVVALGEGTKLVPFLMDSAKRYRARVAFGASTDTDDAQGEVISRAPVCLPDRESIIEVLASFTGVQRQVPPVYSALKMGGEALHRKARRGEKVAPAEREVRIDGIELLALEEQALELDVRCGKGTYIRSLARDLGPALGTLGHLAALRRTETSGFEVEEALGLDELESLRGAGELRERLVALTDGLPALPSVPITAEQDARVIHGQAVPRPEGLPAGFEVYKLIDDGGRLRALARIDGDRLQPFRVFKIEAPG